MLRYADKIDARGQDFLRRCCEASQHMDRLIDDLLQLSRVGRSEMQRQKVDLTELAKTLEEELRQAEPQRAVKFVLAPKLLARGDQRLLRIVLENLLRNAWKFSSKKAQACVEVGRLPKGEKADFRDDDNAVFFVRDNGVGFDMAHADQLFGVFQRLHSTTDFPGTGVGLATVQRIISRHGGRVWAKAAVNQGATFYFSLPTHGET
jgi:light-regulated signal transduction histidine kinase (bacteriophytochrome)